MSANFSRSDRLLVTPASRLWVGPLLLLGLLCSCGKSPHATSNQDVAHLRVLGLLYGEYMANNAGAVPSSEQQFAAYIEKQPANWNKLAPTAVEFLTKSGDGQALTVRYGKDAKQSAEDGRLWVAFEAPTTDGTRWAVDAQGNAQSIDDAQFATRFQN
jgi:hypothetical protein